MLFNSYEFLFLFLPVLGAVWWVVACTARQWLPMVLLAASALFYALWGVRFFVLLAGMTCLNYILGLALDAMPDARSGPLTRKRLLGLAVALNLLPLCWFKYAAFLLDNINLLPGVHIAFTHPGLPLGISFYTFLQIAWLVTVYRREARPEGFGTYAVFVSSFPYVISGPIVRYGQIAPQLGTLSAPDAARAAPALTVFVIGLAKKVLLADTVAVYADSIFHAAEKGFPLTSAEAWAGSLAYTFQLYFDFSGYTDMAIGVALLLGLRLPDNFDSPYKSTGIVDFWRRWHITLSSWLRDFLYIPLGGSRKGRLRQYRNLFLTMLLGGIWHGAGWPFVVWGALHGAMLSINHFFRSWVRDRLPERVLTHPGVRLCCIALTFLCINAAWVVFRAETMQGALHIYSAMLEGFRGGLAGSWEVLFPNNYVTDARCLCLLALCGLLVWGFPNTRELVFGRSTVIRGTAGPETVISRPWLSWTPSCVWATWLAVLAMGALILLSRKSVFLYFKF